MCISRAAGGPIERPLLCVGVAWPLGPISTSVEGGGAGAGASTGVVGLRKNGEAAWCADTEEAASEGVYTGVG